MTGVKEEERAAAGNRPRGTGRLGCGRSTEGAANTSWVSATSQNGILLQEEAFTASEGAPGD